jgi:hypothetical protein
MSFAHGLQVMGGLLVDVWRWGFHEPALTIDMRRVNVELRKDGLVGLEDDVAYRNRVKQRMRDGARCVLPPLIDRKKVLPFAALRGDSSVAPAKPTTESFEKAG